MNYLKKMGGVKFPKRVVFVLFCFVLFFRNATLVHSLLPSRNQKPKGMSIGILAGKADGLD